MGHHDFIDRVSLLIGVFHCASRLSSGRDVIAALFTSNGEFAKYNACVLAHDRNCSSECLDIYYKKYDDLTETELRHKLLSGVVHSVTTREQAARFLTMLDRVGEYGDETRQASLERFTQKSRLFIQNICGD